MRYIENKYSKWYFLLVNSRKHITRTDCYIELHHIIPKSLGGRDTDENCVYLTAREHYIAHLLLVKITEGQDKSKMAFALKCMSNFKNKYHERYIPPSKIYDIERKHFSEAISEIQKGHLTYLKKHSEESKKKISVTMKKNLSEMTKEENAIRVKNSMNAPHTYTDSRREKISKALIGKKLSDDTKKKLSNTKKQQSMSMTEDERKQVFGSKNKGKSWTVIDGKRTWIIRE